MTILPEYIYRRPTGCIVLRACSETPIADRFPFLGNQCEKHPVDLVPGNLRMACPGAKQGEFPIRRDQGEM